MTQVETKAPWEPQAPRSDDQRAALFRLLLILVGAAVATVLTGATRTVLVVTALIVMVLLHELGHFLTAKWAGMKVTEFFFGFGPRLWSIRRGETEYGVKALPLGGYCKIPGMTNLDKVDPEDEPRTYRQKPYWRRLSVAVAGSTVHFILAFLLLFVMLTGVGVVKEAPRIGHISELESGPSPAQQAGLRTGDRLLSYDGRPFRGFDEMTQHIRERPEQPITFEIEREGRRQTVTVTTVDRSKVTIKGDDPGSRFTEPTGFVGIGPAQAVEKVGPVAAVGESAKELGRITTGTVNALVKIFAPSGASSYGRQLVGRDPANAEEESNRFLSPVGFVRIAGYAANAGIGEVLLLLILINVFVGIFNMVPLLPFDGGHVAIATYERLRSRRGRRYQADVSKALPVFYMVIAVLVFIGISSLYLDIVKPVDNPFR